MKKLFGPSIKHTKRLTKILKTHIYPSIMHIINENCLKMRICSTSEYSKWNSTDQQKIKVTHLYTKPYL